MSQVPMPGHAVTDEGEFENTCAQLQELVQTHDVVFLLMDSREGFVLHCKTTASRNATGRWLPTLLAAAHNKLALSTALGFDSFVVMRHGANDEQNANVDADIVPGDELGCYFCMDVTAPGNVCCIVRTESRKAPFPVDARPHARSTVHCVTCWCINDRGRHCRRIAHEHLAASAQSVIVRNAPSNIRTLRTTRLRLVA